MAKKVKTAELKFEEVLPFLKEGKTVRREEWGASYRLRLQPNFGVRAYKAGFGIDEKGERKTIEKEFPAVYCKATSFDAEKKLSWSPSLSDLLAEDWVVVLTDEVKEEATKKPKAEEKVEETEVKEEVSQQGEAEKK